MKNQFGITLVELLVTLAVISVLVALVAPQFGSITAGSKQASAANALVTDIAYTRNEAVTRNTAVTIAAKGATPAWANGWTVTVVSSNTVLRDIGPVPSDVGVSANPNTATSLTYQSDGSQSSGAATIKFCNNNLAAGNNGLQISIITSGRQTLDSNAACP